MGAGRNLSFPAHLNAQAFKTPSRGVNNSRGMRKANGYFITCALHFDFGSSRREVTCETGFQWR